MEVQELRFRRQAVRGEHWILWRVAKALLDAGEHYASAGKVQLVLYMVHHRLLNEYGIKLLSGEFMLVGNSVSYDKFEDLACEAEALGLVEYIVEVEIPEASCPHDVDIDYVAQEVESKLEERSGVWHWKYIRPLVDRVDPPPDLVNMLRSRGLDVKHLEEAIDHVARLVVTFNL